MKKFSQEELIDESVWNAVKSGVRLANAGVRAGLETGKAALDIAAPELTQSFRQARDSAKKYGQKIGDAFSRGLKGPVKYVADRLLDLGYILATNRKYKRVQGGNYLVYAYKIDHHDDNGNPVVYAPNGVKKEYPLLVNPETGFISKNITNARNLSNQKNLKTTTGKSY